MSRDAEIQQRTARAPRERLSGWLVAATWAGAYICFEMAAVRTFRPSPGIDPSLQAAWLAICRFLFALLAWDCTLVVLWFYSRWRRVNPRDPVPLSVSAGERVVAENAASRLAILLPAHQEAQTEESSRLFEQRVLDLMACCPARSQIAILFDSPASHAGRELDLAEHLLASTEHARRAGLAPALTFHEYRRKPPHLRTKPGSIYSWMKRHREQFDYLFVVDADSSLTPDLGGKGYDRDVILRLLVAMTTGSNRPDLIQTRIQARNPKTIMGCLEAEDAAASSFYGRMFALIYGAHAPCFGHNFICRTDVLWRNIRTDYLSHDMVEAASIAAEGGACFCSSNVLTYEDCEEPLSAWMKRDERWGRGCAQWTLFLLRRRMPWGARLYLVAAIFIYVSQVAGCLAFILATIIVRFQGSLYQSDHGVALLALGAVGIISLAPRLLGGRPLGRTLTTVLLRSWLNVAIMWWRALAYLASPFGKGWVPRNARTGATWACEMRRTLIYMSPGLVIGVWAWRSLMNAPPSIGVLFILGIAVAIMSAPLLGCALCLNPPVALFACAKDNKPRVSVPT